MLCCWERCCAVLLEACCAGLLAADGIQINRYLMLSLAEASRSLVYSDCPLPSAAPGPRPIPLGHSQVAQSPATRRLADHVNNRAAAYIGQVLLRPSTQHFPAARGESQMAINCLRAAELLSDDSNFRAGLIPLLAPTAAHLLTSGWLAGWTQRRWPSRLVATAGWAWQAALGL